jgi:hypothetical protein
MGLNDTVSVGSRSPVQEVTMITRRRTQPAPPEHMLDLLRREFSALPGLRLSTAQLQRMLGVGRSECDTLIQRMVDAHYLVRTADGSYMRADVQPMIEAALLARGARLPRHVA